MRLLSLALLVSLAGCIGPARIPVPLLRKGSGAIAGGADVSLSCAGVVPAPPPADPGAYPPAVATRCNYVVASVVQNPGPEPRTVTVEIDARGIGPGVAEIGEATIALAPAGEVRMTKEITLGPGEARTLRTRGLIYPAEGEWDRNIVHALAARHPVLAWDSGPRELHWFAGRAPFDGRVEQAPLSLRVQYPAGWSLRTGREQAPGGPIVELSSTAKQGPISAVLRPPARWIAAGGPVLGLGGSTAGEAGSPLRFDAAVGYEIGVPRWIVGSLLLDSDFKRRLVIAPAVELASPYLRVDSFVFPSLALGLGAPVRLFHEQAPGIRGQATISFPSIGVVGFFDWFPALRRAEPVVLVRGSM